MAKLTGLWLDTSISTGEQIIRVDLSDDWHLEAVIQDPGTEEHIAEAFLEISKLVSRHGKSKSGGKDE